MEVIDVSKTDSFIYCLELLDIKVRSKDIAVFSAHGRVVGATMFAIDLSKSITEVEG